MRCLLLNGTAVPAHLFDELGDGRLVVGMLVRDNQFRCGRDGSGIVAVHSRDLVGPFPAVLASQITESPDALPVRRRTIAGLRRDHAEILTQPKRA